MIAFDAHDHVIEAAETRQVGVDVQSRAGAQQADVRVESRRAQHRHEQRRLVLAVAVLERDHL